MIEHQATSPYLNRPIRSLDEYLREQAEKRNRPDGARHED